MEWVVEGDGRGWKGMEGDGKGMGSGGKCENSVMNSFRIEVT